MRWLRYILPVSLLVLPLPVFAHCPLCTAGIGVVAVLAAWLGVSTLVIGVFIGALAVAIGFWIALLIRKTYVPAQKQILVLLSFFTTILPIAKFMPKYTSIYLPFVGDYGRTFVLNEVMAGSVIGAILVLLAPTMSRFITRLRGGSTVPYQGVLVTMLSLILGSFIIELFL